MKPRKNFGIRGHLRPDDFQGDDTVDLAVGGLVDRSHSAFPEKRENLIAIAEEGSRLKKDRISRHAVGADDCRASISRISGDDGGAAGNDGRALVDGRGPRTHSARIAA